MSIDNYSFETAEASPAPPGRPADWAVVESGSVEEFADFAVSGDPGDEGYPRDTFEIGWPDLTQEMIFTLTLTVDEFAIFNVGVGQRLEDDFETEWAVPQGDFELLSIQYAEFESEEVETFDASWGDLVTVLTASDLQFAQFIVTAYDAFEGHWKNNEASYIITGTPPTTSFAAFNYPSTTYDYSNFEAVVVDQQISAIDIATDKITVAAHGFSDGDIVYFYPFDDESSLPDELDEDTPYLVLNATTNDFEVEAESGSGKIDFTDVGTGTKMVKANKAIYWTEELTGV